MAAVVLSDRPCLDAIDLAHPRLARQINRAAIAGTSLRDIEQILRAAAEMASRGGESGAARTLVVVTGARWRKRALLARLAKVAAAIRRHAGTVGGSLVWNVSAIESALLQVEMVSRRPSAHKAVVHNGRFKVLPPGHPGRPPRHDGIAAYVVEELCDCGLRRAAARGIAADFLDVVTKDPAFPYSVLNASRRTGSN